MLAVRIQEGVDRLGCHPMSTTFASSSCSHPWRNLQKHLTRFTNKLPTLSFCLPAMAIPMYTFAPSSDHKVVHPPPLSHRPSKRAYREISSGRVILIGHRFLITSYKRTKENKNKHIPRLVEYRPSHSQPSTSMFFDFVFFEPRGVEVSWPGAASSRLPLLLESSCIPTVRSQT